MKLQNPRVQQSAAVSKSACSEDVVRSRTDCISCVDWFSGRLSPSSKKMASRRWIPAFGNPQTEHLFCTSFSEGLGLSWIAMDWVIYPRKWGLSHMPTLGNELEWNLKHMDWQFRKSSLDCWKKGDEWSWGPKQPMSATYGTAALISSLRTHANKCARKKHKWSSGWRQLFQNSNSTNPTDLIVIKIPTLANN